MFKQLRVILRSQRIKSMSQYIKQCLIYNKNNPLQGVVFVVN